MSALILKSASLIFHLSVALRMTHCAAGRRAQAASALRPSPRPGPRGPPRWACHLRAHRDLPGSTRPAAFSAGPLQPASTSQTVLSTAWEKNPANVPKKEDPRPRRSVSLKVKPDLIWAEPAMFTLACLLPHLRVAETVHLTPSQGPSPWSLVWSPQPLREWSNLKSSNPTWRSLVLTHSYLPLKRELSIFFFLNNIMPSYGFLRETSGLRIVFHL